VLDDEYDRAEEEEEDGCRDGLLKLRIDGEGVVIRTTMARKIKKPV